ncbi:MAG: LamB/YcsF family protein, partial [Halopseudomonas sp.]
GSELLLDADTLCVHGDNPAAVEAVRRIRAAIGRAAIGRAANGRAAIGQA